MAIEIVDFPIKNGWIFHSYVSSPEGNNWFMTRFMTNKNNVGPGRFSARLSAWWPASPELALLPREVDHDSDVENIPRFQYKNGGSPF